MKPDLRQADAISGALLFGVLVALFGVASDFASLPNTSPGSCLRSDHMGNLSCRILT